MFEFKFGLLFFYGQSHVLIQIWATIFYGQSCVLLMLKNPSAKFWAIFPQTNLVTLVPKKHWD
jgi:hypothetical protein